MMRIKMAPKGVLLVSTVLGLAGCAIGPQYRSLDASLPGATLRVTKGYDGTGLGSAAVQHFRLGEDEYCDTVKRVTSFTSMTADQKDVRVPYGRPVIIWAVTEYVQTTGVSMVGGAAVANMNGAVCSTPARFTPESDHVYEVRQRSTLGGGLCTLEIVDLTTGAPAAGVELISLEKCRERGA